jgi:NAD(P) transhydrogenase subunit alpha
MLIGVLKEARNGEPRVAATPFTVGQLIKLGYDVVVEPGAGEASSFSDEGYVEVGARVGAVDAADILLGVDTPARHQLDRCKPGVTVLAIRSGR